MPVRLLCQSDLRTRHDNGSPRWSLHFERTLMGSETSAIAWVLSAATATDSREIFRAFDEASWGILLKLIKCIGQCCSVRVVFDRYELDWTPLPLLSRNHADVTKRSHFTRAGPLPLNPDL